MTLTVISRGFGTRIDTAGIVTKGYGTGGTPPPPPPPVDDTKTGTGGIDPGKGYTRAVKPLGLPPRKKIAKTVELKPISFADTDRKALDDVALVVPSQPEPKPVSFQPIDTMSMSQIDAEIGQLLRAQLKEQIDLENRKRMIILLLAAST